MATIIGAIGGVIVVFTVPMLDKMKIDDVVGAIPVHLFAGIWGTLAVVLTNGDATMAARSCRSSSSAPSSSSSAVVWFILKATMGIRVSEEDEMEGLDAAELGLEAYPEFGAR
jgi:Amt family ammonium transporter